MIAICRNALVICGSTRVNNKPIGPEYIRHSPTETGNLDNWPRIPYEIPIGHGQHSWISTYFYSCLSYLRLWKISRATASRTVFGDSVDGASPSGHHPFLDAARHCKMVGEETWISLVSSIYLLGGSCNDLWHNVAYVFFLVWTSHSNSTS